MIRSFKDLVVYQKAFEQAMRLFEVSKTFPSGYINLAVHNQFSSQYEQIGKMLGAMISEPEKFCYDTKRPS